MERTIVRIKEGEFMNSKRNHDDGFTGLEAAIVLIAFIVVAAVFSYVVLGAGFFTTQKAQETVHTGVAQATSAVELSGPVMVNATSTRDTVGNVTFYLQLAAGGNPVDMQKVIYTISTSKKTQTVKYGDTGVVLNWVKKLQAEGTTDNILESREMVLVDINLNTLSWTKDTHIGVNDKFMVEVKPPVGASYPITRTLPPTMDPYKYYEVY